MPVGRDTMGVDIKKLKNMRVLLLTDFKKWKTFKIQLKTRYILIYRLKNSKVVKLKFERISQNLTTELKLVAEELLEKQRNCTSYSIGWYGSLVFNATKPVMAMDFHLKSLSHTAFIYIFLTIHQQQNLHSI